MNTRFSMIFVSVIAIFFLNAFAMAQPSTVTTSATFGNLISIFPKAVLSTINSVVVQSTNATSAAPLQDSAARRDNLALQLGLWQSGSVGVGVKYWLSELTAMRFGVQANIGAGLGGDADLVGASASYRLLKDTIGTSPTAQANGVESVIMPSVNFNVSVSAAIEKHLFAKRNLSPYVGFGCGISVVSNNYTIITNGSGSGTDSGDVGYRSIYVGSHSYIGAPTNAKQQGLWSRQVVVTRTTVGLSAYIIAGAEYFILPSLSLTGEASLYGGVSGSLNAEGRYEQRQSKYDPNQTGAAPPYYQSSSTYKSLSETLRPGLAIGANIGFSSSLSLSLYFGRNVLGDIVNAFSNGTLFQW